jgi:type IV secretory pathway TrbD component
MYLIFNLAVWRQLAMVTQPAPPNFQLRWLSTTCGFTRSNNQEMVIFSGLLALIAFFVIWLALGHLVLGIIVGLVILCFSAGPRRSSVLVRGVRLGCVRRGVVTGERGSW